MLSPDALFFATLMMIMTDREARCHVIYALMLRVDYERTPRRREPLRVADIRYVFRLPLLIAHPYITLSPGYSPRFCANIFPFWPLHFYYTFFLIA